MTVSRIVLWLSVVASLGWVGWSHQQWRQSDERLALRLEHLETAVAALPLSANDGRRLGAAAAAQVGAVVPHGDAIARIETQLGQLAAKVEPPGAVLKPEPTTEQLAAATAARTLIGRSIERGLWTDEGRQEFAGYMNVVDDDARDELVRSLVRAVNAGKLAVAGPVL